MPKEQHSQRSNLCMCFVGLEKVIDRVPRKMLAWIMRKKGIPKDLVRLVVCLCDGARNRVTVNSELPEELDVNVGMHQGSMLSPFRFATVVEVVAEFSREGALSDLLYADVLVLMS